MTEPNDRERLIEELRKFAEISGDHLYCHDPWNKSNPIRIAVRDALAEIDEQAATIAGLEWDAKQLRYGVNRFAETIAEQAAEIGVLQNVIRRYCATCNQLQAELAELRRRV